MSRQIWNPMLQNWPGSYALDLFACRQASLADCLEPHLSTDCIYVGWSLGGLAGIDLAYRYPGKIKSLVLVAATPKFVSEPPSWSFAIDQNKFAQFYENYVQEPGNTWKHFLALQSPNSKSIKQLKQQTQPAENGPALLNVLKETDMRAALSRLQCPVSLIIGRRDALLPAGHVGDLLKINSTIQCFCLEHSGHTPFLDEPDVFNATLKKILSGQ